MKILLAEDEVSVAHSIVRMLEKSNYNADAVYNGIDAVNYLINGDYDAVILDVMMPGLDGIEVLRKIRGLGIVTPVLILSARSDIDTKVLGLDSGANDYMTKPFDAKELLARIRAMTRSPNSVDSRVRFGNITLDRAAFTLASPNGSFTLANKEFQIMEILLNNPAHRISPETVQKKSYEQGYSTVSP